MVCSARMHPYHPAAVEAMKVMTSGLTEEQIKDVFYNNCAKLMGFDKNNFPRTKKRRQAEVSSVSRFFVNRLFSVQFWRNAAGQSWCGFHCRFR